LTPQQTFGWFRKVAVAEGFSFLLLLGVAMPLKYLANWPMGVRILGSLHGGLFVAFIILAWEVKNTARMPWSWLAKAFIASILPFGTIVLDKQWKKEAAAMNRPNE
jgi:integral membrane protein